VETLPRATAWLHDKSISTLELVVCGRMTKGSFHRQSARFDTMLGQDALECLLWPVL
jgi:hypothetical protein